MCRTQNQIYGRVERECFVLSLGSYVPCICLTYREAKKPCRDILTHLRKEGEQINVLEQSIRIYDLLRKICNGKVNREMCRTAALEIGTSDHVPECGCGMGLITAAAVITKQGGNFR